MPSVTPFLWFDDNLGQALAFYRSVFPDMVVTGAQDFDHDAGQADVTQATFEIHGQRFIGLNAGPQYHFTEAFSMFLSVQDQAEVDHYWAALTAGGGEPGRCGWLKDQFGLSWQVVPEDLGSYLGGPDPAGARRALAAMMTMSKLDIGALEAAYRGR